MRYEREHKAAMNDPARQASKEVGKAIAFARHCFKIGDAIHLTIFKLAQALQGTEDFAHKEFDQAARDAFDQFFDHTLADIIDYAEALSQFRRAWNNVKHPVHRQDPKTIEKLLKQAAESPPKLAMQIAKERYRGSTGIARVISMALTLSTYNPNGVIILPTRTVALVLGNSDWKQAALWINQLEADGIITKVKDGRKGAQGRSPQYVWTYCHEVPQIRPSRRPVQKKKSIREARTRPVAEKLRTSLMRQSGISNQDYFYRVWKRCVDLHEGFEDFSPADQAYELRRAACDIPR